MNLKIKQTQLWNLASTYNIKVVKVLLLLEFKIEVLKTETNALESNNTLLGEEATEVGKAPLIHLKKYFFKKGFYRLKLARELKFYAWIITFG